VAACRTALGLFRVERDPQGFELTRNGQRQLDVTRVMKSCLDSKGEVQLFVHRCSNVPTSLIFSRCLKNSASLSPVPLPIPPAIEISIRDLYSGISSRVDDLSLPTRLRVSGLYLLTPGTSRAKAEEAAAVIGFE
jgi:hypothetical protein